ncbi:MAG: type II toxin-antitoxin system RelE/ParE family toxin [Clostridia bacterium]|nr:type II toxin-antitoxin system RelE/ParE family toxin [Clostridia bacterium]
MRSIIDYKIELSSRAQSNLFQIEFYIDNFIDKMLDRISILENQPYIGKIYNQIIYNNRVLIHNKYLIFYEIKENENTILIKSVLNDRRNIKY